MDKKTDSKKSNNKYQQYLNKNDPFDKLIIELVEQGELNLGFIQIKPESPAHTTEKSPQKPALYPLKKHMFYQK